MENHGKSRQITKEYICKLCDYKCYRNSEYVRHINTAKHKRLIMANENTNVKSQENADTNKLYVCDCGKGYKHMSSLCKHKRSCNKYISDVNKNVNIKTYGTDICINETNPKTINMIMEMMKQNNEFTPLKI